MHSFLLSDEANSGYTLYITPMRLFLSYPHVTTKMSVLEPILFSCFELLKTTSPSRQTYHSSFLVAATRGTLSGNLEGVLESLNPEFAPSHSKIECSRIFLLI